MSKEVVIRVPRWVSEEEVRRIVEDVLSRLGGRVDIDDLRKSLGIKHEDLSEEPGIHDTGMLRDKEKERLFHTSDFPAAQKGEGPRL